MEPLEHGLHDVYVYANIDLGWIADLLRSPPETTLLNLPILIGPAHIHSMDWESIGERVVVVRHC